MKSKFNLDGELPLNKTIEIYSMIIVGRTVFHENNHKNNMKLSTSFLRWMPA